MTYSNLRELSIEVMRSRIEQIAQQFDPLIEKARANNDSFLTSTLLCKKRHLQHAAFDQRIRDEESIYFLECDAQTSGNCPPNYRST